MLKLWVLLGTLASVACPGRYVTRIAIEDLHPARSHPPAAAARDLAPIGAETFVAATGPPDEWQGRQLVGIDGERVTPLAAIPPARSGLCRGARLVAGSEGRWWYSQCDGDRIQFVTSAAPLRVHSVAASAEGIGWDPIEGDEPAGVLLSYASPTERLVKAELITPSGSRTIGEFERNGHLGYAPVTWQAHRLKEDAVALVALEEDDLRDFAVIVRVFRDGELQERRVPFAPNRYIGVMSAARENTIAVVASKPAGAGLAAIVFDADAPQNAKAVDIDGSDAQSLFRYGSQIVPLGERFVVTWENANDHTVRIAEFGSDFALPAVVAGEEADPAGLSPLLYPTEEGVRLFWSHGALIERELPAEASGYLLAAELWKFLR